MNVSSVTTFGSAAIASPPTSDAAKAKPEQAAEPTPAQQVIEIAKQAGLGQLLDKTV